MPEETPTRENAESESVGYAKLKAEIITANKHLQELLGKKKDSEVVEALTFLRETTLPRMLHRIDELKKRAEAFIQHAQLQEGVLHQIREELLQLQERVKELTMPPLRYATVDAVHEDGTITVIRGMEHLRVQVALEGGKHVASLTPGERVLLNVMDVAIGVEKSRAHGRIGTIQDALPDGRLSVVTTADDKYVIRRAGALLQESFTVGDRILFDAAAEIALEKLTKAEDRELWLEEIPNVTYEQIGGLKPQIQQIQEEVEFPFLHRELFAEYALGAPKGILLYGPPGCGKTLIAKAIARNLARHVSEIFKHPVQGYFIGYFINVKGPELLDKYVGESERKIREVFARARERARESCPVIMFFDEADALFPTRGTGISSDIQLTNVPQFLAELDGVEELKNVLVILATNRQELIDPAVLRSGRIDRKILIKRPDKEGAREIFGIFLKRKQIPIHLKYTDRKHPKYDKKYERFSDDYACAVDHMIAQAVERLWATKGDYSYVNSEGKTTNVDNSLIEVILEGGEKITLYLRDFVSGAMIENIVRRARQKAVLRVIACGREKGGLQSKDFCAAIEDEMSESEDLTNTGENVQQWLAIQGRKERVVHVRSLVSERRKEHETQKQIETITTGHYL